MRPTERAQLSEFCTKLTGINQTTVDAAPPLADVLASFHAFLLEVRNDMSWQDLIC